MTDFKLHTAESAPEGSKPILTQAQKSLGFIPNLYAVFAESPAMLKAYTSLGEILEKTSSFNATERQVVKISQKVVHVVEPGSPNLIGLFHMNEPDPFSDGWITNYPGIKPGMSHSSEFTSFPIGRDWPVKIQISCAA